MRRVDEAVREVLADAIGRLIKDPRVGFVTVTGVSTSPDLRQATVFVSFFTPSGTSPDQDQHAGALAGLSSAHGMLQAELSRQLRMKRTPMLEFVFDETTERAFRLDALIEEVVLPLSDEPTEP